MWYLKKTAQTVWNASKNFVDQRTPVQKLISSIAGSTEQILPTNKLAELASLTYELETFDEIVEILLERLKKFTYDIEESQESLNLLIATNYLIKHGATAFVDIFRTYKHVFKKYQELVVKTIFQDFVEQAKLQANLDKIKSRAHHIYELLDDKQKLLKEKQLSMLVKQKLKLYEKNKLSELNNEKYSNSKARENNGFSKQSSQTSQLSNLSARAQNLFSNPKEISHKLQGLLETYVWKYVDKLDETIETASDKIMEQIDKYIISGEKHEFELEDDEDEGIEGKKKNTMKNDDEDDDLMRKLEEQVKNVKTANNENLLEFEEVAASKQEQKKVQEDLI